MRDIMNLPDYIEASRRTKLKKDIEYYNNDIKNIGLGKTYHIKT